MSFPKFVYRTKNTPFFSNFARFCTPKRCTRVQCLVLKNSPNYVNFWTSLMTFECPPGQRLQTSIWSGWRVHFSFFFQTISPYTFVNKCFQTILINLHCIPNLNEYSYSSMHDGKVFKNTPKFRIFDILSKYIAKIPLLPFFIFYFSIFFFLACMSSFQ